MNHYVLVTMAGETKRPATPSEVEQLEIARARRQELRIEVDGVECQFVQSRDIIAKNMFAKFGECQLRAVNGRILRTIRDPKLARPAYSDGVRVAPPPANCECRDWGELHPGRHHPVCSWNKIAPKTERAARDASSVPTPLVMKASEVPSVKPAATGVPVSPATFSAPAPKQAVPTPEACICREWARNDGDDLEGHHKICQYHDQWEIERSATLSELPTGPFYLFDINTMQKLREATLDEFEAAQRQERESGNATVTVGDQICLVASESDLGDVVEEPTAFAFTDLGDIEPSPEPEDVLSSEERED